MHIKLRSKPGGRLQVLDGEGKVIDGVLSVDVHADGRQEMPVVRIVCLAELRLDAEAEVRTEAPKRATKDQA